MTAPGRRGLWLRARRIAGRLAATRVSFALPVILSGLLAFLLARTAHRLACGAVSPGDGAGSTRESAEGAADPTGAGSPAPETEDLAGTLAAVRPAGSHDPARGPHDPARGVSGERVGVHALAPRAPDPAALAAGHGLFTRWFLPALKRGRRAAEPFRARAPPGALHS